MTLNESQEFSIWHNILQQLLGPLNHIFHSKVKNYLEYHERLQTV